MCQWLFDKVCRGVCGGGWTVSHGSWPLLSCHSVPRTLHSHLETPEAEQTLEEETWGHHLQAFLVWAGKKHTWRLNPPLTPTGGHWAGPGRPGPGVESQSRSTKHVSAFELSSRTWDGSEARDLPQVGHRWASERSRNKQEEHQNLWGLRTWVRTGSEQTPNWVDWKFLRRWLSCLTLRLSSPLWASHCLDDGPVGAEGVVGSTFLSSTFWRALFTETAD